MSTPLVKPTLRGYFHQEAFFLALGACVLLIARSSDQRDLVASSVYTFGLLFLFGVSAIYHRLHWEPKPRAFLKRIDHSAIFIQIAGTITPLCLLALPEEKGQQLLILAWVAAFAGVLQSIFWVHIPKWLSSAFYVGFGLLIYPYLPELGQKLGTSGDWLILSGGLAYVVGAVFYSIKRPNIKPGVFGYHELFHVLTVIGAGLHFVVIYRLIQH